MAFPCCWRCSTRSPTSSRTPWLTRAGRLCAMPAAGSIPSTRGCSSRRSLLAGGSWTRRSALRAALARRCAPLAGRDTVRPVGGSTSRAPTPPSSSPSTTRATLAFSSARMRSGRSATCTRPSRASSKPGSPSKPQSSESSVRKPVSRSSQATIAVRRGGPTLGRSCSDSTPSSGATSPRGRTASRSSTHAGSRGRSCAQPSPIPGRRASPCPERHRSRGVSSRTGWRCPRER